MNFQKLTLEELKQQLETEIARYLEFKDKVFREYTFWGNPAPTLDLQMIEANKKVVLFYQQQVKRKLSTI